VSRRKPRGPNNPKRSIARVRDRAFAKQAAQYMVGNPTAPLHEVAEAVGCSYSVLQRLAASGLLDAALNAQLAALDSHDAATDIALMLAETATKRRDVVHLASKVVDTLFEIVQAGKAAALRGWAPVVDDDDGKVDAERSVAPTEKTFLAAATLLTKLGAKFLAMHEARALGVDADGAVDANPTGEVRIVLEGFDPAPTVRRFDNPDNPDNSVEVEGRQIDSEPAKTLNRRLS